MKKESEEKKIDKAEPKEISEYGFVYLNEEIKRMKDAIQDAIINLNECIQAVNYLYEQKKSNIEINPNDIQQDLPQIEPYQNNSARAEPMQQEKKTFIQRLKGE